jgi:methionyl-tRNA formyltransferase
MAGIVLFGMGGAFSRVALETLLAEEVEVRALVVPGLRSRLLAAPRRQVHASVPTVVHVAWARGLPVIEMGRPRDEGARDLAREQRPAVLAVACFPWLLPRAWVELAPRGALNIHPSLLPAYRGPDPIFWQLREGETRTGVTVHRVDQGVDTGPIVAQADVPFPDGLTRDALEARLAEAGARLLAAALRSAAPGRPQPAAGASRQGPPTARDLEVPTTWPARRAFSFMRGAADRGPFTVLADVRVVAREALAFSPSGGRAGAVRPLAEGVEVGFSPGTVAVTTTSS